MVSFFAIVHIFPYPSKATFEPLWRLCKKSNKSITPNGLIEQFKIEEHVAFVEYAKGSKEECELALHLLVDWNRNHISSLAEMQADTSLDFIRIKRKKGEIESTKCMNGECVAQIILSRENAF